MKLSEQYQNGTLRLMPEGELDHHGAGEVMRASARAIERHLPRRCVLDLGRVSFMDSSGVALILHVNRRVGALGGRFAVENVPRQPLRVLDASGIGRIVDIEEKREEKEE